MFGGGSRYDKDVCHSLWIDLQSHQVELLLKVGGLSACSSTEMHTTSSSTLVPFSKQLLRMKPSCGEVKYIPTVLIMVTYGSRNEHDF